EPPSRFDDARFGISILNNITGHERYGFTDWWI
ncbi:hypothetical protein LCGC14_1466710, partial [marine sediment metagenome]